MSRSDFLTSIIAALALTACSANAADDMNGMEKCTVTDDKGHGLIKAHMAECKTESTSCAGQNAAGDPNAWILVPAGECTKIQTAAKTGDFSGVSDTIKDKIDISTVPTHGSISNGSTSN